jgi:hypothetical protein
MGPSMDPSRRDALARTILNAFAWGIMIVGGVVTFFTFGLPAIRVLSAQFWAATPCTIVSSGYREGTLGTARHSEYVPVITFAYTVAGQSYQAARYDLSNAPDMRLHDIEDVLRQFPARARRTCYVNPRDPSDAVLTRGAWRSLTIGLAPIVFFAAGVFLWIRVRAVFPRAAKASSTP